MDHAMIGAKTHILQGPRNVSEFSYPTCVNQFSIAVFYISNHIYRHCSHSMRSRVYETIGRPSCVCLSHHSAAARRWCCGPGGQEISIDCCTAGSTAAYANSVTLSSEHRLVIYLFIYNISINQYNYIVSKMLPTSENLHGGR